MIHMRGTAAAMLLALAAVACPGSDVSGPTPTGYDLSSPEAVYPLPDVLREISGLVCVGETRVACIQDESGTLFVYDLAANRIATQKIFAADGDYEGIARVDDTLFVLRSDGNLFEIVGYASEKPRVNFVETAVPAKNTEGVCYDGANGRLLIAAKSRGGKGAEFKSKRMVYGFDLKTRSARQAPVFTFDLEDLARRFPNTAAEPSGKAKGERDGSWVPVVDLKPSAMGVHPLTGKLYILSGSSHLLIILNSDGAVEHIEQLDPSLFSQAEGIAFNREGDMFISNEGTDGPATILRFPFTADGVEGDGRLRR